MRRMMPVLTLALVLACCADPNGVQTPAAPKPATPGADAKPAPAVQPGTLKSITFEEFFALHQADNVLVLDARPAFFYNLGHIPGALNLPRRSSGEAIRKRSGQFQSAVSEGKTIVTYCTGTTCPDALKLAEQISALGHPVRVFSAGWHAWTDAEMPTD